MQNLVDYIKESKIDEGLLSKSFDGTKNGKNGLPGFSDEKAIFSIARKDSGRAVSDMKDSDRKKFDGGWSNSNNLRKVTKAIDIKDQKDIYSLFNSLGSTYAIVMLQLKWIDDDAKKKFKSQFGELCKVESSGLFVTVDHGMSTQNLVKLFNQTFYN